MPPRAIFSPTRYLRSTRCPINGSTRPDFSTLVSVRRKAPRTWQARAVSDSALTGPNQANIDRWLTFDDVGQLLGFAPSKVRQLVREHQLASVRRPELREQAIPADF